METSGRERRHRYYTVAAYQKLVAAEQLDKTSAGYGDIDITESGGFVSHPDALFFDEATDLHKFEDTFHRVGRIPTKKAKKVYKNPILPDGTVKKGRPRKHPPGEGGARKRKREEQGEKEGSPGKRTNRGL